MSPRPERRADEGENVVMTISAQALATRWQAQYASGDHSGIADTFKLGTGGSAGFRPHELLEAALASCMIISARMELAEQGLDDTGVGVAVEVEREEAVSRFRYTLILPPQLEGHRSALLARLERSPVRTTLSKTLEFAPGGTE